MSISLEGIVLPDLVDELLFQWSGVQSGIDRTLDGSVIVWEQSQEGRPINLMGGSDWGFITHEILEDLQDLAAVPNAVYTLSYEGVDTSIRFRNEDAPVILASPIIARPNPAASDYYNNVAIRLMEV